MKQKKQYAKPEVKSRKVELGVFGDYRADAPNRDKPGPLSVIETMHLRME